MNIDFPPPSNGTYSNAGSFRRLANYMEHEDLERMEKGIYMEGFLDLTRDNIFKSKVIKDIDSNIGQLMKTDAKFYAIHVSPSQNELKAMGTTQEEQAKAMKDYIRYVFIPMYANNFNKDLTADDIKFYAKIHFDRDSTRSKRQTDEEENQETNNMHCHIIVSRKDQSNKIKLSPLTNHRNTKKGVVKGGFDRSIFFKAVEQGFDFIFKYNRPITESFEYFNTMKNGTIGEQIKMQEKIISEERESKLSVNQSPYLGLSSVFGILSTQLNSNNEEQQIISPKKKRKKERIEKVTYLAIDTEFRIFLLKRSIFVSNIETYNKSIIIFFKC